MWGPNSTPTAGYDCGCLGVAGELSFERSNCALERFAEYPAVPVGDFIKCVDNVCTRLDVKLYVASSAVAPWLPFRRHRVDFVPWFATLKIRGFGDCPHLFGSHGRRYGFLWGEAGDVEFQLSVENACTLTSHLATSASSDGVTSRRSFAMTSPAKARALPI